MLKYQARGVKTDVVGMNEASATLLDRVGVFDKPHRRKLAMSH